MTGVHRKPNSTCRNVIKAVRGIDEDELLCRPVMHWSPERVRSVFEEQRATQFDKYTSDNM